MSPRREDARLTSAGQALGVSGDAQGSSEQIAERWRFLRSMLIQQLDRFENGGLTLHADQVDVSKAAIADLKRNILEFDALISAGP